MVHPHGIIGHRQAGFLWEYHMQIGNEGIMWVCLLDGIIKQSHLMKRCMIRTFCSAMLLQGHVVLNMAPAQPHQCGATGQSHNHRSALAQAGELMIDQFTTSVTSSEQHVCMAYQHSAFTQHHQSQVGRLFTGISHMNRKQRHYVSSLNGTIKQSCLMKVYILQCSIIAKLCCAKHSISVTTLMQSNQSITQLQTFTVCCWWMPGEYDE